MGKKNSIRPSRFPKFAFTALLLLITGQVFAADLPLASGSVLAGFTFDDKPLSLPVQRNFQMAMLTASSELGRSCGKMEAYGWRMNQSEQGRVNQIFNSTVDRLRALGYSVEAQSPTSVSRDITIFTADRTDNHFVMMWSAGEIGLVMVLCKSSAPIAPTAAMPPSSPVDVFPQTVVQGTLPPAMDKKHQMAASHFSPVGSWYGSYTCGQGYTGATLEITSLHGENFEGSFRFYPTPKNPSVPAGRYNVSGQYDHDSNRILINPGKWIERPTDYYNTVMVGSFDPVARTFSAYFQGITGCTSFEARSSADYYTGMAGKAHKTAKKPAKKKKKKIVKKKAVEAAPVEMPAVAPAATTDVVPSPSSVPAPAATPAAPVSSSAPAASAAVPAGAMPAGIQIPAPTPAPLPPVVAPTPVPAAPATEAPTSLAPSAPPAPAAAPATAPAATPPASPPPAAVPAPSTTPAPAGSSAPKPSGALEKNRFGKSFMVASVSGQYVAPYIPPAQQPIYVNPNVPTVQPTYAPPPVQTAPTPYTVSPVVQQVPPIQTTPPPYYVPDTVQQVPDIQQVPPAEIAPQPQYALPTAEPVPAPEYVPDNGRPEGTPP